MKHNNDHCQICDATRIGESPECDAVLDDYPLLAEMEDTEAKGILVEAFKQAHKLRCEFFHWMMKTGLATRDIETELLLMDGKEVYKLPDGVNLHPGAMLDLEDKLQQMAQAGSTATLRESAKLYVERFTNFLEGQRRVLTPEVN